MFAPIFSGVYFLLYKEYAIDSTKDILELSSVFEGLIYIMIHFIVLIFLKIN